MDLFKVDFFSRKISTFYIAMFAGFIFFIIWKVLFSWAQILKDFLSCDHFSLNYGGLKTANSGQLTRDIIRNITA